MWICMLCVTVHLLVTGVTGKDAPRASQQWMENPCEGLPQWIHDDFTVCGEGHCKCRDGVADCSFSYGALTYIPALPSDTWRLVFTENGLVNISTDDFFVNATSIRYLDLGINDLQYISGGAFRPLQRLTHLRLSANKLTYSALGPVLSVSTLRALELSLNPLGEPPAGLFDDHPLPYLHTLCLNRNGMVSLNMSVFSPLSRLSHLQLANNHLSRDSLYTHYLPQLVDGLFLTENSFNYLPQTCRGNSSLFPNLVQLDMERNTLSSTTDVPVCLPRLQFLSLKGNVLHIMYAGTLGQDRFPMLTSVDLGGNTLISSIEAGAFTNPTLQRLDLSSSGINFAADSVDADSFAGSQNLVSLELGGNDLSLVSGEKFNRLVSPLRSLAGLDLQFTNMATISAVMFSKLSTLEVLSLRHNKLTMLPDGVFDSLPNLKTLDVFDNRITTVQVTTFNPGIRQHLTYVNLANNPFLCGCELRWFQQWLATRSEVFASQDSYVCDNLVNTTVQVFYVADQACLWSPAVSKFIIATIILLVLPLTAGTVLYRYRWHIRLVWYEAARGRGDRWCRLQEQNFRYDVFVSYDHQDLDWVCAHLMPELEGRLGLRLCLHQRDFTLGAPIVENIEESVKTSKKIMMLFSKNFADSHWCQFELQLCLTHVLEHGDALLVVLLEDIPSRGLTPAMMAVMKTVTYIEWGDQSEARASFWDRVSLALNDILSSDAHSGTLV